METFFPFFKQISLLFHDYGKKSNENLMENQLKFHLKKNENDNSINIPSNRF